MVCAALLFLGLVGSVHYYMMGCTKQDSIGDQSALQQDNLLHTQRQLKQIVTTTTERSLEYPQQLSAPPADLEQKGYIILESLKNSGSFAVLDLLNFQCWGTRNKLKVVEPAINVTDGAFKTDLFMQHHEALKPLDQYYHMKEWDSVFVNSAVTMNKMVRQKEMSNNVLHHSSNAIIVDVDSRYKSDAEKATCMHDSKDYRLKLKKELGLTVTKELCFHTDKASQEILSELSELLATTDLERFVFIMRNWPERESREQTHLSQILQCEIEGHERLLKQHNTGTEQQQN